MEGVLAEEMNRWEVQSTTAGLAAAGFEDDGFGGEFFEFFLLGFGFGAVAGD